MNDITKCKGTGCPYKEHCYRYTASAEPLYQSYFVDVPLKEGKCDMYWGANSQEIWDLLKTITNDKARTNS